MPRCRRFHRRVVHYHPLRLRRDWAECELQTMNNSKWCFICDDQNLPITRELDGPAEFGSDPAGVVVVGVALSCPS